MGKNRFVAVKLDMSKAYDRVEWSFLDAVMCRVGFAQRWQNLIMQCISYVEFSLLINGQQSEKFYLVGFAKGIFSLHIYLLFMLKL